MLILNDIVFSLHFRFILVLFGFIYKIVYFFKKIRYCMKICDKFFEKIF